MKLEAKSILVQSVKSTLLILGVTLFLASCGDKKVKKEEVKQTEVIKSTPLTAAIPVENKNEEVAHKEIEVVKEVAKKVEKIVQKIKATPAQLKSGKAVYMQTCFACHQATGQGIPNAFPPLAKSDYLNADVNRAIDVVLNGKTGPIKVNGVTYNSVMTAQPLTDQKVADVLTYVYNNWENSKKVVTAAMVKKRRALSKK